MNDEKINIAVKCPNPGCNALISFRKKVTLKHIEINCPECKKRISFDFDTTAEPQSYKSKLLDADKDATPDQEQVVRDRKKDTVYGVDRQDRVKTPPLRFQDIDDDDDFRPTPPAPKRRQLREKIFLTHVRMWGMKKDKYRLSEGRTTVGRADTEHPSDISLRGDDTISRRSIVISIEADAYGFDYKLRVLNATNPVRVNGRRLKEGEEVFLEFGDTIKLGNSKLIFDNK